VVAKLLKMQMLSDDDELEYAATKMSVLQLQCIPYVKVPNLLCSEGKDESLVGDGRPAWMKTLNTTSSEWLAMIPFVRQQYGLVVWYNIV